MSAAQQILPRHLAVALVILSAFAGVLVWDQWTWWSARDEYMFGFLVPIFVAYVVRDRWPRLRLLAAHPSAGQSALWLDRISRLATAIGLVSGLVCFGMGAFYRAGAGASYPGSLALALGFACSALSIVFWAAPRGGIPPGAPAASMNWRHDARDIFVSTPWRLTGLFVFPATVWLISAPLLSAVENTVSTFLLGRVTAVVFFVFEVLGLPLERHGSVLILPRGEVGVAEACSGIRSLTGSVFVGCFLAAVFLPQFGRKCGLVASAVALAFLMNIGRSLALTGIAYAYGSQAIKGWVHDATGFGVLGATFLGLAALLPLFRLGETAGPRRSPAVG